MVGEIELLKRVLIKDKKGNKIFDSGMMPSNSFVVAFLEHLYGAFVDSSYGITDTGNTSRDVYDPCIDGVSPSQERDNVDATVNDDDYGIVVGTGTTAESSTDYKLDTQIAHGAGAGELQYGSTGFTAPSEVGGNVDFVVTRTFTTVRVLQ
ncbi:unnamed protein product [marine sediment metagenome]|uniref:Uncharacterized protein n=1 Tax=marine sediment metagenome TaxID=412755 RepID=X1T1B2_9ZZZZ